jgi:O-antigen ligase/polysaccharide polymerase Wzy-like membrane protein
LDRFVTLGSAQGRRSRPPHRSWMPRSRADGAVSARLAWATVGFTAAAVAGLAIASEGGLPHLVVAAEAIGALLVVVWRLGPASLWIWVVASGALYAFLRVPSGHPIITFDRVWILACLSLIVLNRRRIATTRPTRLLLFTLAWLAIAFGIRAFTTSGPNLGFQAITLWLDAVVLPLILFLAAAKLTVTRVHVQRLGAALALGGVLLACIGIAEKVFGFELATKAAGSVFFDQAIDTVRISGPYPSPAPYALSLLICIAATLYWIQARRGLGYVLGAIALLLQGTALGLTFFRAAWIAAAVVVVVLLSRRGQHARTVFIVVYALAISLLAFTSLERNRQFATRAHNTSNLDARLGAYRQSLEIFRMKPIYGVGVTQYPNVASSLPSTKVNGIESVPYPHDSYLSVLAEQGILGLAPFVAASLAVWYALRRFRRRMSRDHDRIFAAGVVGAASAYLLMSLPLDMSLYGPSNAFFALFLGAACGRYEAIVRDSRDSTQEFPPASQLTVFRRPPSSRRSLA